ncbi:MAG TPA: response regulator [Caldimonas sp.]|jgi:DNA-binding NarL/FixJ family response regulator|nr:response regulator [Caldimonas sp.]HEV7576506.1 response regulator [Caldimonas sp.]
MPLITILVEDSAVIRESLVPAMAELAHAEVVAIADTADDAIVTLKKYEGAWQLAVIDLYLKQGTGLAVLRAFRSRAPNQHMVVLTNYATPEIRRRCNEVGADAVFDKSTEIDAFFALCASYLKLAEGGGGTP